MITIEPCKSAYKQSLADLILPIQQNEFNVPITLVEQPDLMDIDAFYRNGNGNFFVALYGNKVVGTIGLLDCDNGLGALRKMFVHKDFRGRQYGTAQLLYNKLESWAIQKGFKEIVLGTIDKMLAAHKFYRKNGFVGIEKDQLPANFPLMKVDNLFFRKTLSQNVMEKINLLHKAALIADYWNPRIAGELNRQQVKLVKFKGPFVWHFHEYEDELFYVIKGSFVMELRDKNIELNEGEFLIVPKGVEHRPNAKEEVWVMLFEPASTLNTGNTENEFTKQELDII